MISGGILLISDGRYCNECVHWMSGIRRTVSAQKSAAMDMPVVFDTGDCFCLLVAPMSSQKNEPQHQTKQSETFAARKAVLEALIESQAKEHAYYAAVAEAVGKHMQALCTAWSRLLISQVRDGAVAIADRFSLATGIQSDQLSAWRNAHRACAHAEAELASAQN
jgi:hypothetical protein